MKTRSSRLQEYLPAALLATLITGGLFILMQKLIEPAYAHQTGRDEGLGIRFTAPPQLSAPNPIVRNPPPRRPDPISQPPRPDTSIDSRRPSPSPLSKISDTGIMGGGGLAMNICPPNAGCGVHANQGGLTPLVRIPPLYPRQAAQAGISGFVILAFTVNPDGYVSDVTIIDADPPRVFDRAATKALLRWRFRPMQVDGVPVSSRATQTMEFSLED